jgi:hypothetical protein
MAAMSDQPTHGTDRGARPSSTFDGSFLGQHKYPQAPGPAADATAPDSAAPARPAARSWKRVGIPVGLFLLLIAGVAWLSQNLPSWKQPAKGPPKTVVPKPVEFTRTTAEWGFYDKKKDVPIAEFERGEGGHYDFLYQNTLSEKVTMGAESKSCGCSQLKVCPLSPSERDDFVKLLDEGKKLGGLRKELELPESRWQTLEVRKDESNVVIGPGGVGLLRLYWGKDSNEQDLHAKLWMKPESTQTQTTDLSARLYLGDAVRVFPDKSALYRLDPGGHLVQDFLIWTATRDTLTLSLPEPDPCVVTELTPVPMEKFKDWYSILFPGGVETRVRCAYQLRVTLFEQREGKQLDMGVVVRPVRVKAVAGGKDFEVAPTVFARVRGEVECSGLDEYGTINLSPKKEFLAAYGTTVKVFLSAPPSMNLTLVDPKLPYLKAQLGDKRRNGDSEAIWDLQITVPPDLPGLQSNTLPKTTALVFQATAPDRAPRLLRIPVSGTAAKK